MDSFEAVVASILERNGYWVKSSYKVELTKEEKRSIGRPSSPRWELDIVAYSGRNNEVLVVECKSYLDSSGVRASSFRTEPGGRYKLFNEPGLRTVVLSRLESQLVASGACRPSPRITLCLAAGNIMNLREHGELTSLFRENGWKLFDRTWLRGELEKMARSGYDDQVAAIVAKLILRS